MSQTSQFAAVEPLLLLKFISEVVINLLRLNLLDSDFADLTLLRVIEQDSM